MSMNVWPDDIFWIAEPLLPSLVWWYVIMSQIVFRKDWFAVFKVKVTVKDHIIKKQLFSVSSELLILLQLNLVWWHIISWIALWTNWIALLWSRSRSQKRLRIPVSVHLDDILHSCWTFCSQTWYGDATSWAKVSCKKIALCFQDQGHSEGSFGQIWLFLPYLLKCWSFCNQI